MGLIRKKKIKQLNTYPIDKTLQDVRQEKRNKLVRRRTIFIFVVGLFLIGIALVPLLKNQQESSRLDLIHRQSLEELKETKEKQEDLEYQILLLEDEEYIAKLARQELNLSKSNEILINLPKKEETKTDEKKD